MTLDSSNKKIYSDLIGIGISFSGSRLDFKKNPISPEEVLVNAMPLAKQDRLVLQLIHTWLQDRHELIHAENMVLKMETIKDPVEKALLAGLLLYTQDKRLTKTINNTRAISPSENTQLNKTLFFSAKIGQSSFDSTMKHFGIMISSLNIEDSKKMIPLEHVADLNPYIKCRLLFGVNWRADVAALMLTDDYTPTEISQKLGCSYETAHRNHKNLKFSGWPNLKKISHGFRQEI